MTPGAAQGHQLRPNAADTHVHCTGCGYDLHALSPKASCPECGAPVAASMFGDRLRYADHGWLRGVARGVTLVYASGASMIASTAVVLSTALLLPVGVVSLLVWVTRGVILIGILCLIAGAWLLTRQEPRISIIEREVSVRRLTRLAALAALAGFALQATTSPPWRLVPVVVCMTALWLAALGCFAELQRLCGRMDDEGALARRCARDGRRLRSFGLVALALRVFTGVASLFGTWTWLRGLRAAEAILWIVLVIVLARALATLGDCRRTLAAILKTQVSGSKRSSNSAGVA